MRSVFKISEYLVRFILENPGINTKPSRLLV